MPAVINPVASFSPLYAQIKALILARLQASEWLPGEAIPSEMELAARYLVSQGTVRKAIDELASESLLVRKQGKGTFVATHQREDWHYRFLRLAPDVGQQLLLKNHFLLCEIAKPNPRISQLLQLSAEEGLFRIERVQSFSGKPIVFEEIWLPVTRFEGLTLDALKSWPGLTYAFYESKYATHMVRAEEQIKATSLEASIACHLDLAIGSSVLSVERVAFTYGDQPVEVRRALYDTTEHHYENKLN
ncbi:transcriptional regulator, GntR family [Polynucleobacter meluiroseus]|uniref:Transcriptional regulator, GntR family n=1 Tax=Polynucleobacter meluiroseus TaxID=1938814 RepID=A0A240E0S4_9BURK|nr:GntR family transcriptional regulator [Polynucleobacter meluiroseus]SNX28514.1 transcriptional regulator, GntR family [Polynucleobacter meluiroseus]